jgi:hypothetical protein
LNRRGLNTPSEGPKTSFQRFLLARILHRCHRTSGEAEFARRCIQEETTRAGGSRVSTHLRVLVKGGWLSVTRFGRGTRGQIYSPGPLLRSNPTLFDEWITLSTTLFDFGGVLQPFLNRPCLAPKALSINGTLVLALVVSKDECPRTSDLQRDLTDWMTPRTVRNQIRRLERLRIVQVRDGHVAIEADWQQQLSRFEADGFEERRTRIVHTHRFEQERYRTRIGLSSSLTSLRSDYAGFPCCRCDKPSDQVEHFPPRAWGGQDDWYTTWPICSRCNGEMSRFIRAIGPPPAVVDTDPHLRRGADPARFLAAALQRSRDRFYKAFEDGDIDGAHAAAATARDLYAAFKTGDVPDVVWFDAPPALHQTGLSRPRVQGTSLPVKGKPARQSGFTTPDESAWYKPQPATYTEAMKSEPARACCPVRRQTQ